MPPTLRSLRRRSQPDTSSESSGLTPAGTQGNECIIEQDAQNEIFQESIEGQNSEKLLEEKKPNKRIKYQKASFSLRAKLVQMVDTEGFSIRQAAKKLSLKYSTAKCIYKLFVDENRLGTTRISKETLLSTKIDRVEKEHDDSENPDSEGKEISKCGVSRKRVKKNQRDASIHKTFMTDEQSVMKQEFDEKSLDTENKIPSSPSSEKFQRDNSIQTDTTATTPVADHKVNGSPGGISR